ncbi:ATP-grasp domain-containing protein [Streptomyces roseicoloratus]|uniref:ATP-grasp domain-containing protein n=1 Tax=Streptomyces roseicoloratus TaxID=2508722 RepID=A0ABY9RW48_9ACTN|nr:ATP-grasp domain-containing protein [Streptomyces roseicoloratus]WMX45983.1 ATP-grasp domain-containing protein [Streptomyces roseicoloratus]
MTVIESAATPAPDHQPVPAAPQGGAVLVLGGGTRLPQMLRDHGMYVVYAGSTGEFTAAHGALCHEAWLLAEGSEDAWLSRAVALHREVPFVRVVTVRERFLTAAARIGDALGLGGNPLETVLALKDKSLMRRLLAERAPDSAVPARVMGTPGEVDAFVARVGLPFVLKPRDGSGSEGITIVRDEAGLAEARRLVDGRPGALLAEQFLEGPEFSVETFSGQGRHQVLAVTEKFTGEGSVEIGHVVPARIGAEERAALEEATRVFLDAVGLREGPGHTELILTAGGPRVVESHNRPGGDGIVDLVRHVTGLDVRDLLAAQTAGAPLPAPREDVAGAAATWFLTAEPGVVREVSGWEAAAGQPGIVGVSPDVEPGDAVGPLGGSDDRCGSVTAVGATGDEALARAREAVGLVTVRTETAGAEAAQAPSGSQGETR